MIFSMTSGAGMGLKTLPECGAGKNNKKTGLPAAAGIRSACGP